jgi:hypothetical protein
MKRPQPALFESQPQGDHSVTRVCRVEQLWVVTYQGQPIQVVREHRITGDLKYPRTIFLERGRADRVARELNALHQTDQFGVARLGG